jgi:hypothetical protein
MNLRSWIKNLSAVKRAARLLLPRRHPRSGENIFGQNVPVRLASNKPYMSLSLHARRAAICLCWGLAVGIPVAVSGQTNYYRTNGTEYAIVGSLPGDQVFPDAALTPSGGFVVWQDNITDGSGWGISATRLDPTLNQDLTWSDQRVNVQGTNDQTHPRVAMLNNGGAVFVWQGGPPSGEQIYARFLTSSGTWLTTNDVLVDSTLTTNVFSNYGYTTNLVSTITTNWNPTHTRIHGYTTNNTTTITTNVTTTTSVNTGNFQISPAVATLANGNVVVVWAGFNQAGTNSLLDVYGQILSPTGQKVGTSFLINQFTAYNQRTPAIAALNNGGFVVVWVSEQERVVGSPGTPSLTPAQLAALAPSVDIYARLYASNGVAQTGEFQVNTDSNPSANPSVAAASDGSFMVAWGEYDMQNPINSWDVYARPFSSAGVGGTTVRVNSYLYGDQYAPRISAIATDYLMVWTSLGQDGSWEGVFGQFLHADGSLVGGEFGMNTTTISRQMQPVVTSDGVNQFLAVWTSFTGSPYGFDLYAQRYANVSALLQPMSAPFVYAPFVVSNGVYQPQLQVSWAPLQGISISNYEVYVDGVATPMALTTNNVWTMTASNTTITLAASSTHSFQLDYVTTDGRRPLISAPASGTTWSGANYYGIPSEWMEEYYGLNFATWPANVNAPLVPGGPTLYQVFLSGGDPLAPATWLKVVLTKTPPGPQPNQAQQSGQTSVGLYLNWNTQPGLTYQVQVTTDFMSWSNLGSPRFAAGSTDSIYVGGGSAGYYRVLLLRQ